MFCAAHVLCMFVRNQIKRALSQPPAIAYVAGLLTDGGEFVNRTELADYLCEEFHFHDARGHAQRDGCLKALRELEAAGHFTLPAWAEHAQAVAGGGAGSNGSARPGG